MSEYIFENKDKKELKYCTADQMKAIADGIESGTTEVFACDAWMPKIKHIVNLNGVFRVRKPPPTLNQIDWAQFPEWVAACATSRNGRTCIYEAIPKPIGSKWYNTSVKMTAIDITDFPGFKRGTVAPKDSLLIRPIGE